MARCSTAKHTLMATVGCFVSPLSPYVSQRNHPESGGKCHPNFFPCQLGEWETTLASSTSELLLELPMWEAQELLDLEEVSDT